MPPIRTSVKQAAFEAIRRRILTGRLLPGTPLGEAELQRELELTRTPVRDALELIRADGLAEPDPGRPGMRVVIPHHRTIRAAASLRMVVELVCVGELACLPAAERDLTDLESIYRRMEQLAAKGEPGDEEKIRFFEEDLALHRTLAMCSGYVQAIPLLRGVQQQLRLVSIPTLSTNMGRVQAEHRALLDALAAGDAPRAGRAMRSHLRNAARRSYGWVRPFLDRELPARLGVLAEEVEEPDDGGAGS